MKFLLYGLKQFCFLLLIALVLMLGVNVFMRYVMGSPIAWSIEAGRLLLIWLSFMGMAVAAAERRHMAMDLLRNAWKGGAKTGVEIVLSVIIILSCAYVVYYGVEITEFNRQLNSEELQISYSFFYAAIPAGFFFYLLFEIRYLMNVLAGHPVSLAPGHDI